MSSPLFVESVFARDLSAEALWQAPQVVSTPAGFQGFLRNAPDVFFYKRNSDSKICFTWTSTMKLSTVLWKVPSQWGTRMLEVDWASDCKLTLGDLIHSCMDCKTSSSPQRESNQVDRVTNGPWARSENRFRASPIEHLSCRVFALLRFVISVVLVLLCPNYWCDCNCSCPTEIDATLVSYFYTNAADEITPENNRLKGTKKRKWK